MNIITLKVWEHFKCKNLGEYSDIDLKCDVLLSADVFENFRSGLWDRLDAAHYISVPGLAFDATLYKTGIESELFTDVDMYMFIESGIRGGISTCVQKHVVANNKYLENYNPNAPSKYITYGDANNLYGFSTSQPLPYGNFKWENKEYFNRILIL